MIEVNQRMASGAFFVAFGAFAVWAGRDLAIGTAADMGIGYTPRMLAIGCIIIGLVLMAQSVMARGSEDGDGQVSVAWWPLTLVTLMVIGFGVLLPLIGLPLTVVVVTLATIVSGEDFKWPALVAIAATLALLTTLMFATALQLQIPVWPF